MLPMILLTLQAIIVIIGTLWFSRWVGRHDPNGWRTWGWGALAFVASQVARIPLLLAFSTLFAQGSELSQDQIFWINFVILTVTSGLFEETARYIVLRWLAKGARRWQDGVMFGAGHGGIEAILIMGGAAINGIVLLSMSDTLLAQAEAVSAEQVEALATQIDALRNIAWWQSLLGVWERVLAITFHIAASLWVLRAVREGEWQWWAYAALLHMAFNALALIMLQYGGAVAAEVALTGFTLISLWIIRREVGGGDEGVVSTRHARVATNGEMNE